MFDQNASLPVHQHKISLLPLTFSGLFLVLGAYGLTSAGLSFDWNAAASTTLSLVSEAGWHLFLVILTCSALAFLVRKRPRLSKVFFMSAVLTALFPVLHIMKGIPTESGTAGLFLGLGLWISWCALSLWVTSLFYQTSPKTAP